MPGSVASPQHTLARSPLPLDTQPPDCYPDLGECGNHWVVIPYVLSFVLLVAIIMLNLFTAVILENFEKQQEQEAWRLNPQSLEDFVSL